MLTQLTQFTNNNEILGQIKVVGFKMQKPTWNHTYHNMACHVLQPSNLEENLVTMCDSQISSQNPQGLAFLLRDFISCEAFRSKTQGMAGVGPPKR